jgi:tRNA-2-methylthio-N6-dimethylallyladenosine synthase
MNRKHTAAAYLDLVAKVRAARPDIALSSDFIVGFPGESEADFEATLELIRRVGFASTFSFKYSPRPGTPGAEMAAQVDDALMRDRLARLQALVEAQRQAFNAGMIGRTLDVLFERAGRHAGQLTGKTPYLQQVQVDVDQGLGPDVMIGRIAPVTILSQATNSLFGRLEAGAIPQLARSVA